MSVQALSRWIACCLLAGSAACVESQPFSGKDGTDLGADPGPADPGGGDVAGDPGALDPGVADPGEADPGGTDPGVADPGVTDPGEADAVLADPGPADSGADVLVPCQLNEDCDDGNPCTNDLCVDDFCSPSNVADATACEPANKCFEDGHCQSGVCVGAPVVCPTGGPCVGYTCNSQVGCITVFKNGAPCEVTTDPCSESAGTCNGFGTCVSPPRHWTWIGGDPDTKERATSLLRTPDNEVLVTGWAETSVQTGERAPRAWLLGPGGVLLHSLSPAPEEAVSGVLLDAVRTASGYFLVGRGVGPGGNDDGLVLLTDAALHVVDVKHHAFGQGALDFDEGYVAVAAVSSGFVAVGATSRDGLADNDVWVSWLDLNGDVTDTRAFGGASNQFAGDVVALGPAAIAVAANTASGGSAGISGWVFTLGLGDAVPKDEWTLTPVASDTHRTLSGIGRVASDVYLVTGTEVFDDPAVAGVDDYRGYVARLEKGSAAPIWEAPLGDPATDDRLYGLSSAPLVGSGSGHWIAAGQRPGASGVVDGWLMAVSGDETRRVAWSRTYQASDPSVGGKGYFEASAVSSQGWIAAAGFVETTELDEQAWVVTTDPWGAEACELNCAGKTLSDCDNGNKCSYDLCSPSDGQCDNAQLSAPIIPCDINPG